MKSSYCEFCLYMKEVVSGKGTRFLMCQKSSAGINFPKYPPQPVLQCGGFEVKDCGESCGKHPSRGTK
jgi:hypothetical protein